MTLVLFDIDGTLLLARGAGGRAMEEAGREVVDPAFSLAKVDFAGRLDPLIYRAGLAELGIPDTEELHRRFRRTYAAILAREFASGVVAESLPGVRELVARLRETEGFALGLLTGNYPETGRMKLEAAGLDPAWFPVAAWGSDGESRDDLPAVAMALHAEQNGSSIDPGHVAIIGDTPLDIVCARANGCRVLAVGTGPVYSMDELRELDPDLLLPDLTDTARILSWLRTSTG